METLNVKQGTPEWLVARVDYDCASEAAAALGFDKKTSRTELMRMKATGSEKEFSDWVRRKLFEKGHEIEREARRFAEARIGDLYPQVGVIEINGLRLLASFDGLTSDDGIVWECKSRNAELLAAIDAGDLPNSHWPQVEQQLLISQADYALFTVSDGTEDGSVHFEYRSRPDRRALLLAGWAQWHADFEEYVPAQVVPAPVAAPIRELPAIIYRLDGLALTSNLSEYKAAALKLVEDSKAPLTTDQDFADCDALCKKFKTAEDSIKILQAQVVGEIKDVDAFCRDLEEISDLIRQARLNGEKKVTAEKENRRNEIMQAGKDKAAEHIAGLNKRLGKPYMPTIAVDFAGVMKGKKTITSLRDAVDTELARFKIEANTVADRIQLNLSTLREFGSNHIFLFADTASIVLKAADDLTALVKLRIAEHEQAEAVKLEAQRKKIQEEERVKAEVKVKAEQDAERLRVSKIQFRMTAMREWVDGAAGKSPATIQEHIDCLSPPTVEVYQEFLDEATRTFNDAVSNLVAMKAAAVGREVGAAQKKIDDEARAQAPATVAPMLVETVPTRPLAEKPGVGWPFPVDRSQGQAERVAKRPAVDNRPPITTGSLCALAGDGCSITAAFIQSLGISPAERPKEAKSGTYWAAADVPVIFAALARHFEELATTENAIAA